MKDKKTIVITTILIILLVLIIGISYALWTRYFVQEKNNTLASNCFDITFKDEKEVVMQSMFPQTDEDGLTNDAYKVTIENKCEMPISYRVKLKLENNTLNEKYIKVGVGTNIITLSEVQKEENNYIIREDILPWKGKRTLDIRSWMEENTPLSEGQNKSYSYKIDIEGTSYNETRKYLAKEIVDNNKVQEEVPDFSHASPEQACDDWNATTKACDGSWTVTNYGDGLFVSEDDDGTSYYFRGEVYNNNVKFANRDWKILRINGDGTIRLIAIKSAGDISYNNASDEAKYVGYTYDNSYACTQNTPCISNYKNATFTNEFKGTNSSVKIALENWYKQEMSFSEYDNKIALATYCNDTSIFQIDNRNRIFYSPYGRNFTSDVEITPLLKCPNPTDYNSDETHNYGGIYKLKIGMASVDEYIMIGTPPYSRTNERQANSRNFFYSSAKQVIFSISPRSFSSVANTYNWWYGHSSTYDVLVPNNIYPVINLKPDVEFTTDGEGEPGTVSNPYIVN